MERCTFENKQMFCREGCRCEQQYRLHRLLAYDPTNDCRGIFSDWFKFPSCCVCRCYDLPSEFRLTSRSPRKDKLSKEPNN
uniref:Spaetzle 4 n=1 Tax=Triatoma infestans TaxID=30076 RepID=A0A170YD79_TRIIF